MATRWAHCVAAALLSFAMVAHAQPVQRLGALGDSLTDEYEEESYAHAKAWTEILVDARGLSLGPTAQQAGMGEWGEPRRTGFEDNWARFGATTQDQLVSGAHTGVAAGVSARDVSHVVIWSGGNDFSTVNGVFNAIYAGGYDARTLVAVVGASHANLRSTLAVLRGTPARTVLASPIDFSALPQVFDSFGDPVSLERVVAALAFMRDATRALAREERVVFLDMYALNRELHGPVEALRSTLTIGNVPIALRGLDTATGTTPATGWVDDGVHPNTVVQGLTANAMIAALNVWGAGIAPLTEAQVLAQAGLAYGGSDTLPGQLSPPAAFVGDLRAVQPGHALRFFGNGTDTIDRVVIPLDAPVRAVDVGAGNFTLEFWLKASPGDNGTSACSSGNAAWISGNIVLDRDVFGDGDNGDYGVSLMNGRVAFGVSAGATGATACGATSVANSQWHHVALTRDSASGQLRIWLDGALDGSATGPVGNVSYRDGRVGAAWDPYLVLGAQKHDAGPAFPSFRGWLDELRVSTGVRYTNAFVRPTTAPIADATTVALYHFDEGIGDFVGDTVITAGVSSHGQRRFGGAPAGPLWTTDTPFLIDLIFANGFEMP